MPPTLRSGAALRKVAVPLVAVTLSLTTMAAPAMAVSPTAAHASAPASNFTGPQLQTTLRQLIKAAQDNADTRDGVITQADLQTALSTLGHRAWEQGVDFALTSKFSGTLGDISFYFAPDGTLGIAVGNPTTGTACAMATVTPGTAKPDVWSWGADLGKNCSGKTAAAGKTAQQPPWIDPIPPDQLTGVTVTGGESDLNVTWTASPATDLDHYTVYVDGNPAGTTTDTSYTIPGLVDYTNYTVTVTATDVADNESVPSAPVAGMPVDLTPPPVPTGLTATAGDTTIDLTWSASVAADLDHYQVLDSTGTQVATVPAGTTSYTVTGLTDGTAYTYTVTAVDVHNNTSAASNTATATPQAKVVDPVQQSAQVTSMPQVLSSKAAPDGGSYFVTRTACSGSLFGYQLTDTTGCSDYTFSTGRFLVKTDAAGKVQWLKHVTMTVQGNVSPYSFSGDADVTVLPDSDVVLASGDTITRLDAADGHVVWSQAITGSDAITVNGAEVAYDAARHRLVTLADTGYNYSNPDAPATYQIGSSTIDKATSSIGDTALMVVTLDADTGTLLSGRKVIRSVGDTAGFAPFGNQVAVAPDGSIYVGALESMSGTNHDTYYVGNTLYQVANTYDNSDDFHILKISSDLSQYLWDRTVDQTPYSYCAPHDIQIRDMVTTANGDLVIGGTVYNRTYLGSTAIDVSHVRTNYYDYRIRPSAFLATLDAATGTWHVTKFVGNYKTLYYTWSTYTDYSGAFLKGMTLMPDGRVVAALDMMTDSQNVPVTMTDSSGVRNLYGWTAPVTWLSDPQNTALLEYDPAANRVVADAQYGSRGDMTSVSIDATPTGGIRLVGRLATNNRTTAPTVTFGTTVPTYQLQPGMTEGWFSLDGLRPSQVTDPAYRKF